MERLINQREGSIPHDPFGGWISLDLFFTVKKAAAPRIVLYNFEQLSFPKRRDQ